MVLYDHFVLRTAPQFTIQIGLDKFGTTDINWFPTLLAHGIYFLKHEDAF